MTDEQPVEKWLKPVADQPGTFPTAGVSLSKDLDFVAFYRLPRRRYAIYWDKFTPQEWQEKSAALAVEQEQQKELEAATVAFAQPGQLQTGRDFTQQGEGTSPTQVQGPYGRRGTKWFSFDLPVDPLHPMTLVVTYSNDERQKRTFDILVGRKKVGEQTIERRTPEQDVHFFDVQYALPAEVVKDKRIVTVRFEAINVNEIAVVFGIRMIRADMAR